MYWYHYLSLIAALIFSSSMGYHFYRLIAMGKPKDFAKPAGEIAPAVLYSFTGAMSPAKKESAYQHLPTYTAGLLYHLGSFTVIILWILFWFKDIHHETLRIILSIALIITAGCGFAILIKRSVKQELRELSNPDDYLSNFLVSFFQLISALFLFFPEIESIYYMTAALLLMYFPLGKLKHALYFFAARYHLGFFFGRRGIWPPSRFMP